MDYVLMNDTSHTSNPGCQGSVASLRSLLSASGMKCLRSYPVGFGEERFRQCALSRTPARSASKRSWSHWLFGAASEESIRTKSTGWDRPGVPFNRTTWEIAAHELERDYQDFFPDVDAVVINGEGTIHHNLPGAATLVAWAQVAAHSGLPVFVVNCTIQAMDSFLLDVLFAASKRVVVRESWTFNYLHLQGYTSVQGSDALFAWSDSLPDGTSDVSRPDGRRCIYSPGVLATEAKLTESIVGEQIRQMTKSGWDVSYLTIEVEDERFEAVARRAGASIYPLRRWTPGGLIPVMREHNLVVSGRYHMMIFAWLAGRPVVPMMSNSWKIEGLLEMAGIDPSLVHSHNEEVRWDSRNAVLPAPAAMDRLRTLALRNSDVGLYSGPAERL